MTEGTQERGIKWIGSQLENAGRPQSGPGEI